MKKLLLAIALTLPLATVPITGCKPVTASTPLAPGYINQADQAMGQTLVAAHAFYTKIQEDTAAGRYFPKPSEKTALNNFATVLNAAQAIYIAFHDGQATQAAAQAQVNMVSTQQATLQQTATGGTQ